MSLFESGNCTIENDIIRTQWINRILQYSDTSIKYVSIATTPNGDLVCISSISNQYTNYFFGLKKNGRPYFLIDDQESCFTTTTTDQSRTEGSIFAIKLDSTSNVDKDKEYIISFGNGNTNFELYDFDNNEVYKEDGKTFFGTKSIYSEKATIFKLDTEENYYIITIAGQNTNNQMQNYFVFKLLFNNLNITAYSPIIKRVNKASGDIVTSSCYETENHFIICFLFYSQYTIFVYNYDLTQKATIKINSNLLSKTTFYKCVHFTGEVGAFIYLDNDKNFTVQFKEFIPNTIGDYFNSTSKLKINTKDNYATSTKLCDMIKLNDKKLLFTLITSDFNEFNIFIINNYVDEKLKIRHYVIKNYNLYGFQIKEELSLTIYNGLISLVFGGYNSISTLASLIIFSYPNSTDFSIDITDNFTSFKNPIIKIYEKCIIENNIFGYIFAGYKVYNFTKGLKLLDFQNQEEIEKNSSLSNITDIELNVTNEVNIEGERIEYGMLASEPEYDIYNQYTTDIDNNYCGNDDCNDEKDYFTRKLYFGRVSYLDITFDLNIIGKDCNIGCIVCIKDNDKTCLLCESFFEELSDGRKKCHGEISQTTMTKTTISIPETQEVVPTTELEINTTILLIEVSSIPTTITNEIESTHPNIETSNLSIESTNPNIETTFLNIESTNPNIETSILSIESTNPKIETAILSIQSTNINIETSILSIQSTNSIIETSILSIQSTNSIIETSILSIQSTNSIIETTILTIQSTNINIETSILSIQSTNPIIETSILNIESTNLKIESTNPNIETTILNIETTILKNDNDKKCTNEEILANKCSEGKISVNQIDDIKNILLKSNKTNENSIIKTENVIMQLSTVETQKNSDDPDISSIDLGECENLLKDANNIPREDNLIIFKTDIKTEDLSATYVVYEIYHPYSLEKLNLSVCNDVQISVSVPVKLNGDIELLVNSLSESGYDLFNENDSFYNDICAIYTSENGTDMLLSDRKKDIYEVGQNQSMCQIGCSFQSYNITTKKAKCDCSVSEEKIISLNIDDQLSKKEILDSFYNTLTNSNFHVLKCFKLIINFANIMKNYGEILMSTLFIIFIFLVIIYIFNGQKQIVNYIDLIINQKMQII